MGDSTTTEALRMVRQQAMVTARRAGIVDASQCDDVAQEVMLRAWRHDVLSREAGVRGAWVRTTARRCAADVMRASRRAGEGARGVEAHAEEGASTMSEARLDARRRVRRMLARAVAMPPSLRAVFEAVVCEGRAIDEVAGALALSRAAVDTRLRRMRQCLAA